MKHLAAGLLLVVTGCGTATTSQPTPSAATTAGQSQTAWTRPYRQTTCDDLEHRMSARQRFVMVSVLLTRLRSGGGTRSVPAAVVVHGFEAAMDQACGAVPGEYGVTDVAASVYRTERAHWGS